MWNKGIAAAGLGVFALEPPRQSRSIIAKTTAEASGVLGSLGGPNEIVLGTAAVSNSFFFIFQCRYLSFGLKGSTERAWGMGSFAGF